MLAVKNLLNGMILKLTKLSISSLENIFNTIKNTENLIITKDAGQFILHICNGSVRVLINYLEKIKLLDTKVNKTLATTICTNIGYSQFTEFINYTIKSDNLEKGIDIFGRGYNLKKVEVDLTFPDYIVKNKDKLKKWIV